MIFKSFVPFMTALMILASLAHAGQADVMNVDVQISADGTYRFDVTVQHADTGWDHYADAFEIVSPKGDVLGTRVLLHPHETEQPFTRSLSGVNIPEDVKDVDVRAHDKVHGVGGKVVRVGLPGR
ncbi:hypothetical protein [Magnetovibrio blakemorei]|uniref:Uncharacterized protein n=1 Tax=Magnetovibrio blakemorei TaxID=28181 RepID=A0A1E5Q8A3_9PROT|nr:hypothetical protein [Magnetovibrio blakemorei]OEJ67594.1 hypothetical protein BEN30_09220 [Magnetovibrio blakemorei]